MFCTLFIVCGLFSLDRDQFMSCPVFTASIPFVMLLFFKSTYVVASCTSCLNFIRISLLEYRPLQG